MARTAHSARKAVSTSGGKTASTSSGKVAKKQAQDAPSRATKSLSVRTPIISQHEKPKVSRANASKNIIKEIKFYQNTIGFLLPKAGVVKLIRHIMNDILKNLPMEGLRFTTNSMGILHEALENHLVCLIEVAYMLSRHAKRVTLFASDLRLINRIKKHVQ